MKHFCHKQDSEENNTHPLLKTFLYGLARQILTKNCFTFDSKNYHQVQGTDMGTRMAPSYTNIFMHYLETGILESINLRPTLWFRFRNDIIMMWPHGPEELHHLMTIMNHFHQTIKLTHSYNYNGIAFLDTIVIRDTENSIYTKVYHKPTENKNYLYCCSCHPTKRKVYHMVSL